MSWNSKSKLAFSFLSLALAGCSAVGFQAPKSDVLAKPVFAATGQSTEAIQSPANGQVAIQSPANGQVAIQSPAVGQVASPASDLSTTGTASLPLGDSSSVLALLASQGSVPVSYECFGHGIFGNSNDPVYLKPLLTQVGETYSVSVNGQTCSNDSATIRAQLVNHQVNLSVLCPTFVHHSITSIQIMAGSGVLAQIPSNIDRIKFLGTSADTISVIYAANDPSVESSIAPDDNCESRVDPLVIHVGNSQNDDVLALTAPREGIKFDMLGAKNGHRPIQISWFTSNNYGLLALPDAQGRVTSIDQLFGDATTGPDQKGAANGYAALAKYDGTSVDGRTRKSAADGRIDKNDPVFAKLRVWIDRNRDGIADASELVTLKQAGIEYILLDFTTDFSEGDAYGNLANRKSYTGRSDGSKDLVFDLWFNY